MSTTHKVESGNRGKVEFTIRAKDEGSTFDGSILWSFEYTEGDADWVGSDTIENEWLSGLPAMTGKQLAKFALWLVSSDPIGIASPRHSGRCDDEADNE